jgi:hypothetical protein
MALGMALFSPGLVYGDSDPGLVGTRVNMTLPWVPFGSI